MKKYILPLVLLFSITFSCKKDSDNTVDPQPAVETLPSSFTKRVLLENYTKHCQFCIPVNSRIDSMRNAYPNNTLIPVLIATFHSTEIPHYSVMSSIFPFSVFPAATINRVPAVNSGSENGKFVTKKENWSANIDSELQKSTNYGIKINSSLSGEDLDVKVKVGAFEVNTKLKLTVYVFEDDSYYRNLTHVLSNSKGDDISLTENGIISKSFSANINGNNLGRSSIIAFVHYFNETTKNYEVMNVQEVKVGENIGW